MPGPESYGRFYWCVKVPKGVSKDGEIYVHADSVEIAASGAVLFMQNEAKDRPRQPTLVLAAGMWSAFYAASVLDGAAVAVEHWEGEVSR